MQPRTWTNRRCAQPRLRGASFSNLSYRDLSWPLAFAAQRFCNDIQMRLRYLHDYPVYTPSTPLGFSNAIRMRNSRLCELRCLNSSVMSRPKIRKLRYKNSIMPPESFSFSLLRRAPTRKSRPGLQAGATQTAMAPVPPVEVLATSVPRGLFARLWND